eukprot:1802131-Pyramimonas_sp.AAC.1
MRSQLRRASGAINPLGQTPDITSQILVNASVPWLLDVFSPRDDLKQLRRAEGSFGDRPERPLEAR